MLWYVFCKKEKHNLPLPGFLIKWETQGLLRIQYKDVDFLQAKIIIYIGSNFYSKSSKGEDWLLICTQLPTEGVLSTLLN